MTIWCNIYMQSDDEEDEEDEIGQNFWLWDDELGDLADLEEEDDREE